MSNNTENKANTRREQQECMYSKIRGNFLAGGTISVT